MSAENRGLAGDVDGIHTVRTGSASPRISREYAVFPLQSTASTGQRLSSAATSAVSSSRMEASEDP